MITNEDLLVRLATIEAVALRLETRLLGNGQPGELSRIYARTDDLDERLDKVERTEAKARGAFWAISALVGALTSGELLAHFRIFK